MADLKSHIKQITHECGVCKYVLPNKGDLIVHMGIHINASNKIQKESPKDEQLNANLEGEREKEQNHDIGEKCKVDVKNSDLANNEKEVNVEVDSELFVGEKDEIYQEIDVKEHVVEEQTDNGVSDRTTKICSKSDLEKDMQINATENTHTCEICSKCFSYRSGFLRHMETHIKEKPFKCKTCRISFSEESRLDTHTLIHRKGKQFMCDMCSKGFRWKGALRRHIRVHTQERPYKCLLCHKSFSEKGNLIVHMRVHTGEKPFVCQVCTRAFTTNAGMLGHMKTHLQKKPTISQIGMASYPSHDDVLRHREIHTLESNLTENLHPNATQSSGEAVCADIIDEKKMEQDEHVSKVCEEKEPLLKSSVDTVEKINDESVEKGQLASRISLIHNKEKLFACELCKEAFLLKENLNMHLKHTHCPKKAEKPSRKSTYICDMSGRTFPPRHRSLEILQEIDSKEHVLEEQTDNGVCGRGICTKIDLEKNMHIIASENSHTCEICTKSFSYRSSFLRHMETHMIEKPFKCETCRKYFSEKSRLDKHMARHRQGKQFSCDVCRKGFRRKSALKKHIRIHNLERPYKCLVCHKSFSEKGNLIVHMRVHTGEKPFICQVCSRAFSTNAGMLGHMKTHLRKKPTIGQIGTASYPSHSDVLQHREIHTLESNLTENLHPNAMQSSGEAVCADITDEKNMEQVEHVSEVCKEQEPLFVICEDSVEKGQLLSHISSMHNKEKPFGCELWKKAFAVKENLNMHLRHTHCPKKAEKQKRMKTYTCDMCGSTFSLKASLMAHLKSHENRLRFVCRVCHTAFPTKGDLIIHMGIHINPGNQLQKVHHKDEQLSIEVLNTNLDGERDIEENHDMGEKYKVDVQNSDHVNIKKEVNVEGDSELIVGENDEIYQEIDIKEHVVEEQTDNGGSDRTTSAKSDMEKNMPVIAPENSLTCEVCSKCFSYRSSLLRHMKIHMKEKPFQCETCSESFSEKSRLDKHMMIRHRQDNQFICDVCRKGFRRKSDLKKHIRIHTLERPYKCLVCYKTYSDKGNLIKHMRVHTGEKPFVCQVCSRAFSTNACMLYHMKKHLPKKPTIGQNLRASFPRYADAIAYLKSHTPESNLSENLHPNATQNSGKAVFVDITDEKDKEQDKNISKLCEEQECILQSSVEKVEVICDESVEVVEVVRQCNEKGEEGREIVKPIEIFSGVQKANVDCKNIEKMPTEKMHFTCEVCNQWFLQRVQLEEHKKMHAVIPVNQVSYLLIGNPIVIINQ